MAGVQAFVSARALWSFRFVVPEAYFTSCYRYHTTSKIFDTQAFTEDCLVVKGTLDATVGAS